jgi:hypothetical protein
MPISFLYQFILPAMVADRVVVLPGTKIGRGTIMGSGALCKRDTTYADGETWMGNGTVASSFSTIGMLTLILYRKW